jgi:hypothetical protein
MSRISYRSLTRAAILIGLAWSTTASAQGGPPGAGLAAQLSALQAQVASLTGQVTALSNAVTALEETAGAVQVWRNTHVGIPVQRNDATFVSDWTLSTLAAVSLPAGTYLIVAKTSVQDPLVSATTFYCDLAISAGTIDFSEAYSVTDEPETIALQKVITLSAPDTVALRCGATGPASTPGSAESFLSQIAAIKASL